ncbi:MAG TPA: ATP-binding protein [Pyrinomonadaceae bacterium]|nr:ATP-binding protein [Pyrinomonadaceae bacterium]
MADDFEGARGANERGQRLDVAATLSTAVEMVRRVMRVDTAGVATFSLDERTVTWKAISGFRSVAAEGRQEIVNPLRGEFAERAAEAGDSIIEVRGLAGDLPASEFPLHSAEGVRDLALVPLAARGETLGVLAVGFRTAHRFTAEEKLLLEGLAGMAALALDNARLFETVETAKKIWEQTFDAIPDGIIVHDAAMRIARCNLAAAEMMGLGGPTEVVGMSCAEAFARLFGERAAAYHMKQGTGSRTASAFELQAEDGRRYLVTVSPLTSLETGVGSLEPEIQTTADDRQDASDKEQLTSDGGLRTPDSTFQTLWSVITWSDITELSEIQEQLARSRRLATVGQLAAGVAHEINNPLAAITTCAEAVLRDVRGSQEASALAAERNWNFYLEEVVRQALRGKAITRGLLDLSRQRRARRESVDLNAVAESSARLFEQRGRERGVRFEVSLDPSIGDVATDESMVRQILDNLLANALDATPEGGRVRVRTAIDAGRVLVEVDDTGPGIPHETLARIFDPFFTTKDPGQGSGLGLAISLTLAEALGGALTAESKPSAGSRFRLWIPRRAPDAR